MGEQLAVLFLKKNGYHVVAQNWRTKHLEIDIVAKTKDLLIFVEVKTRSNNRFVLPEEAVDQRKEDKLKLAAEAYVEQNEYKGEIRFDIIAIIKNKNEHKITHFKDAFWL